MPSPSTRLCTLALVLAANATSVAQGQQLSSGIVPRSGLVITASARVKPGTYLVTAPASLDSAVIVVRGSDVTLDLSGVTLLGDEPGADPDRAHGVAIRVDGGTNVRIVGARIRGFKVGILARDTRELSLIRNDLSHNWKPRLYSLVEHESLADWLSYHRNDHDEWLRYGAAIYLSGVHGGEIRGNRVTQGMNALMMTRTDSLRVWENDFSFNSGVGIGLYRSSDHRIMHNTVDYDVRGYSHGFYRRGQDSAGILLYEQSCRNVVAYNSVTHGGDGLFLWAGQSTMDTGQGGANDNLFFGNDFSYAPTNGMEATFSRNTFVANRIAGSDYGLWGGYSFNSLVLGNQFTNNRIGIAIEHGQDNRIAANRFAGDTTAISLWANAIEPSDWGYPKHRDTKSRDVVIERNEFARNRVAVRAVNTTRLAVTANRSTRVDSLWLLKDTSLTRVALNAAVGGISQAGQAPDGASEIARYSPKPLGSIRRAPSPAWARLPRAAIVVDEWGPYDWRSPKLWPIDSTRSVPLRLQVLGPPGTWSLATMHGVASVSKMSGAVPDTISITPTAGLERDWSVALEYRGAETVSPRGVVMPADTAVRFTYEHFEAPIDWRVRVFAWTDSTDPRTDETAMTRLLVQRPVTVLSPSRLAWTWFRPTVPSVPQQRFVVDASGVVTLSSGRYTLRTISDDGIRVWVDGILRIDHWTPHESEVDTIDLPAGTHDLRVQYYQVDGWTELRVEIARGSAPKTP